MFRRISLIGVVATGIMTSQAQTVQPDGTNFLPWLEEIKQQALNKGISAKTIQDALASIKYDEKVGD